MKDQWKPAFEEMNKRSEQANLARALNLKSIDEVKNHVHGLSSQVSELIKLNLSQQKILRKSAKRF